MSLGFSGGMRRGCGAKGGVWMRVRECVRLGVGFWGEGGGEGEGGLLSLRMSCVYSAFG